MEAGQYCTFVIHQDGAVSACGKGSYGRLGLGTSSSQPVPCRLTFDQCRTFRHVSSSKGSDGHTLALTVDGRVYSWGDGKLQFDDNTSGKLLVVASCSAQVILIYCKPHRKTNDERQKMTKRLGFPVVLCRYRLSGRKDIWLIKIQWLFHFQ